MAVTAEDFVSWASISNNDAAQRAFDTAVALVDEKLVNAYRPVPEAVQDQCVLEVAHNIYKRKDSPSGSSQGIEFGTGQAVMGPRDPLTTIWPTLRKYVLPL